MAEVLTFVLLGLGAGSAYAIAGVGLVQIYRASGVINFAHGGIALLAAAVYAQLSSDWDWPWIPAFIAGLVVAVISGALIQLLVMRPLRNTAVLVKIIATVGVLAIIEQLVPLTMGNIYQRAQTVKFYYPRGGIDLIEGARLTWDRVIMLGVVVAVGVVMTIVMSRTRFGLATTAVSEDQLVAQSLAVNPDRVDLVNWSIGAGLAGLAGLLMVPWASLSPGTYILLVVPALAAALVGRFESFPFTIVGGLAIGALQSLIFRYQGEFLPTGWTSGWNEAIPVLIIIGILAFRGSVFPRKDEATSALPKVGRARLKPHVAVIWAALLGALALVTSGDLADAIISTGSIAIIGLSLVVVIGLAGQVSLAQMAMAGIGALVAARLAGEAGWPFLAVLAVGIIVGAGAGLIFGLPALRTRGPTLAVATIALGLAIEKTLFTNGAISGATFGGIPIERPALFGWEINAIQHPNRFAALTVVLLVVGIFVVSNLRAGPAGRRFLAVRSNERAAAALGISVQHVKLTAFVIAAGLVTIGGILASFRFDTVLLQEFGFTDSLLAVVFVLIGGVGFLLGPVIGAAISPAGIIPFVFNDIEVIERLLIVVAGLIVVAQLIGAPDGAVAEVVHRFGGHRKKRRNEDGGEGPQAAGGPGPSEVGVSQTRVTHEPAVLAVEGLRVAYGPIVAVDGLDLTVRPGEIVGLIGPNGAGKTTALDAISGFVAIAEGRVALGDTDLASLSVHRRARAGLARTFQTVEPFNDLSVAENLAVATDHLGASGADGHRSLDHGPRVGAGIRPGAKARVHVVDLVGCGVVRSRA